MWQNCVGNVCGFLKAFSFFPLEGLYAEILAEGMHFSLLSSLCVLEWTVFSLT